MKTKNKILYALLFPLFIIPIFLLAQSNTGKQDVFQKANNAVNKVNTIIAVFQPYLLKARQIYFDAKQLGTDVKNSSKATFGKPSNANTGNQITANTGIAPTGNSDTSGNLSQTTNPTANSTQIKVPNNDQGNIANYAPTGSNVATNPTPQTYLPNQSLPINNTASVNNDGTGNWGNQNNGLYGNCLDALTGTVMGMGEAAAKPTSVDLLFFAPADGQNTYYLMTPDFAKNNSSAATMSGNSSEQVQHWSDVNETEVALTKLTIGQFNQITNNNQITNAVRNAQDYAGYYASVGQKLDGQVFAVKAQMDSREVYALIAVIKQVGTSGSSGYLQIKIKGQGIDSNGTGQINANAYVR